MPRKRMTVINELYNKPFPSALRELMRERNTTQQELADVLGKTRQSISYYCDGSSSPDWETIAAIAKFYSVSSDWLLGLTDVRSSNSDIHAVCEFTGLGENAVINLNAHYSSIAIAFISELIEQTEITNLSLLYENLKHSRKKLDIADRIYRMIDKSSTSPTDLKAIKDYNEAKNMVDFHRWKVERSIMSIVEKMMEGGGAHGID